MTSAQALQLFALCLALAGAETLHGIARAAWLVPRVGKAHALRISVVTGTLLAFAVCWFFVPGLGWREPLPLLATGLVLALFMGGFDIALGRWVMRLPWSRIARDFDPRSGNYLLFGLLALVLLPCAVISLQQELP